MSIVIEILNDFFPKILYWRDSSMNENFCEQKKYYKEFCNFGFDKLRTTTNTWKCLAGPEYQYSRIDLRGYIKHLNPNNGSIKHFNPINGSNRIYIGKARHVWRNAVSSLPIL